jgi:phosphocarrier protein HPr
MTDSVKETRSVRVVNEYGMHARPAALFVKMAARFESELTVEKDGISVSGKSIMGLMTLQASRGTVLALIAEGADAKEMLDALETLVKNNFDVE